MSTWSGLSNDAALRSKVSSSKFHCGDAVCQISLAKSWRYCVVAGPAAFGGEVELVPPRELGWWWQRRLVGRLVADQVAAHRHHGLAPLGPERGDDVGRPRSPVEPGDDRRLDAQRVHEIDHVDGQGRLLAVAHRVVRAGSGSCRSRGGTARSRGSRRPRARARRRRSCGCRRASRAAERRADRRRARRPRTRRPADRRRSAAPARTTVASKSAHLCDGRLDHLGDGLGLGDHDHV